MSGLTEENLREILEAIRDIQKETGKSAVLDIALPDEKDKKKMKEKKIFIKKIK